MLCSAKTILAQAKTRRFAIPSANFIDLHSARTFCRTAEKLNLPLFLSFAQSHREMLSLEEAAVVGKYWADKVATPVVLHLDHGEDQDFIFRAIELGFTSVMIDASMKSFGDNVAITREVVDHAHALGVSVEAELGHVGANDTSEASSISASVYTEVRDVLRFVALTDVDALAISIGTAHGPYKGTPRIDFARLRDIDAVTNVPLVLHGGSSSGDENLKRCAVHGITKINLYTDFIVGAYHAIRDNDPQDYRAMKELADMAMAEKLAHYFKVFNTQPVKL